MCCGHLGFPDLFVTWLLFLIVLPLKSCSPRLDSIKNIDACSQEEIEEILEMSQKVIVFPPRIGIIGNEAADYLAKSVTRGSEPESLYTCTVYGFGFPLQNDV